MRRSRRDILRRAVCVAATLALVASQLLGSLAPAVAYAADGTTITFPNGGTATMHGDGTITGTMHSTPTPTSGARAPTRPRST